MKIYGHCRFSYFGRSDTGKAIGSLDDAHRMLWNRHRMAARFHLFENLMLPSVKQQTDQEFEFVITTSKAMPDQYQEQLDDLVSGCPNIRILRTERGNINAALKEVMAEASNDRKDKAVHFRLDDDDALGVRYIERLREVSRDQAANTLITFPSGILGFTDRGVSRHRVFRQEAIAIGLALIKAPGGHVTPMAIQHRAYAAQNPTISDDSFCAYHYTRHSTNNTNGYNQTIHTEGGVVDVVAKKSRQIHPEFAAGAVTTQEAEDRLTEAFPYTSGEKIRQVITETLEPNTLIEHYGFR